MLHLPVCPKCFRKDAVTINRLIPFSDYGPEGAGVQYKSWVCSDITCQYEIRVDKGIVSYGRKEENCHETFRR